MSGRFTIVVVACINRFVPSLTSNSSSSAEMMPFNTDRESRAGHENSKISGLRRWGPSMIVVTLVLGWNAFILGPTGNRIPVVSRKAHNQYSISATKGDVVDIVNNANFDEYTRDRHRRLGKYVHRNVSSEFTFYGKITVTVIYFSFWIFLMFPNWFFPIGRPGIALCGGLSMVVWRHILQKTGHGPYFDAERVIIFEPLFLLFGLMLTTIYLEKMERGGIFDKLRASLDDSLNWKRTAKIMIVSTIGAAAVMNDSIVLIFSGVVVNLCVRHKVGDSLPYLLALATTANIGSALTLTGNPHNILIVSLAYDSIGWLEFARNMLLPVTAATIINTTMLVAYFGRELFPGSTGFIEKIKIVIKGHRTTEMLVQEHIYHARKAAAASRDDIEHGWSIWSIVQAFVVVLFLACFAAGFDVCVVSMCAGAILMVIVAYKRQHYNRRRVNNAEYGDDGFLLPPKKTYDMYGNEIDPEDEELATESETTLTEVDYGLLILFIGQFLLIGSFDDTGVPQGFFNLFMGRCSWQMTNGPCVYWFVFIVTILSNIASNMPVCKMLAATFPYATPYDWLHVSFATTIAGNLTMLGSAANMIVAFQAAKAGDRSFTSERHAPFGVPSTFLCLYAGTFLLVLFHFSPDCSIKLGTCPPG